MKKILYAALIVVGLAALLGVGGAAGLYWWASRDLPNFTKIADYTPPLVTTVYAHDGQVLGYFSRERRFLVTFDEIPQHVRDAFLAAEDSGFYQHEGVDITAIVRAAIANLRAGTIRQGGSTITQQIIKQLLLTPERSLARKLKEAILAYRLERYLSKDEILTIYLNQIYLGHGAYGIEAAARSYFGKHVGDLSLAEAAILAGLPQAPSSYNPYQRPEAAKARQQYVLRRMVDSGFIDLPAYEAAQLEPFELSSMDDPSWKVGAHYLEEVRRWLVERYGEKAVYEGGLHVRTALDFKHQTQAEEAMHEGLWRSAKRRGWPGPIENLDEAAWPEFLATQGVQLDNLTPGAWTRVLVTNVTQDMAAVRFGTMGGNIPVATMHWARPVDPSLATEEVPSIKDAREVVKPGDVVSVEVVKRPEDPASGPWTFALVREPEVEGALVSMQPNNGDVVAMVGGYSFYRSQFNRATQAKRQPGSAFKPIVYSLAMDSGYTPASIVLDAPVVYHDAATDHTWKPFNYEGVFYGPTLLRTALVKSRNLVTIRLAQDLGVSSIIERARTLGLESDFPRDLSVALGSAEVTLMNLVQAYSAFPRNGSIVEPRMVLEVFSPWGQELYRAEEQSRDAISPQTAYIMTSLLKEVVRAGTGRRAAVLGKPLGGKTGTTNDERDAWFMGFSPYLITGVYVGFDSHEPMGKRETGARAALPIWLQYRAAVESQYPSDDFETPADIVMARVDAKTGQLAGPGTRESYFLPFKNGTAPTVQASLPEDTPTTVGPAPSAMDELGKQVF